MEAQDENPLFSLVHKRMKFWNDSSLTEVDVVKSKAVDLTNASNVDTPATAALEQFLRFAVEETLPEDVDESESLGRSLSATLAAKSHSLTLKPTYLPQLGVHEVTRGLARITAAN